MANRVEDRVWGIVQEILQDCPGVELVDVEYVRERDWYLRVFIDKDGGVLLDDCQEISEALGERLDSEDFISESYMLEVSSPGLDRVLRKDRDFAREMGKQVDVSLYAPVGGKKQLVGRLAGYDGKTLVLAGEEPIPMERVANVRLHIDI